MTLALLAGIALLAWLYLVLAHGGFWLFRQRLPVGEDPAVWPSVVAVVPARDEAAILPDTLPALLNQDYPGEFRVLLVDDASTDGTGDVARAAGELTVVTGHGPPPGWTGKVAALATGVDAAGEPDYLLFTDADIRHPPGSVRALVRAAETGRDLVSLMARLRTDTGWERAIVPAFVYFFAQLYPFGRVNRRGRTAAAAGGCVLVRREVLARAGGLARISGALIDDVALAHLVKQAGSGRIWLGLSIDVVSLRRYPRLADLWDMVARSAYTQLRYSPALLAGTVLGLALLYLVPPVATVVGLLAGQPSTLVFGLVGWLLPAGSYLPMLRAYRLSPWWAPALPAIALLYAGMTVDSAWRHWRGRGGAWKGRTAP
ncbi:MAG TPA: glycosyltransferase [Pseudonocardiaceae bacterium]|jgi:hopene-associated glycosyltransferase HpnB|nr:glycosyltransferase [Pseudonocardiaceae bacterium]